MLLPALRAAGYRALDPWDGAGVTDAAPDSAELNEATGRRNAELIDEADGLLAVLDGVDVDSGTASEIGYAAARGKPVVAIRSDLRRTGENEAAVVNLQVAYFVAASGGRIVATLEEALGVLRALVPSGA